jgi:hypothetical protein
MTLSKMAFRITTLSITIKDRLSKTIKDTILSIGASVAMLSAIMLTVVAHKMILLSRF